MLLPLCTGLVQAQDPYRNKGWYNITQFSQGINKDVHRVVNFSTHSQWQSGSSFSEVHTELGVFFVKKHATAGLGIGFARYNNPDVSVMPVDLTLRVYLNKVDNSLFLMGRGHGSILIKNVLRLATGYRYGIGYKFFIAKKCFIVDAFLQYQTISMTHLNASLSLDKYEVSSYGFSLGIMPF
ncbi:hypothetical protein SAMN04488029_1580 [Reichenbachiella faecimaris]|uniref:Outer membrane protein beta-barrel domain-containing protein n=1 Tax=Reichenbachiella faecimaris TaxID=692418 RepID=A0A1W2G973_REIFA|nr:hypothetical protein [Reichenbachiella faecimaris]SMD33235.1 hypothetical protein SAMN04488029_1580 [Reichenbachiella faecimaris]